jgi:hypothetical protein
MPHSDNALVRKLSNFIRLSPAELNCLAELQVKPEKIAAQTDIVHEGQPGHRNPDPSQPSDEWRRDEGKKRRKREGNEEVAAEV